MADLKNMTGTEAFQLAKDESALTIEEIAERLTVSPSVIKRYLNAGDNYLPSLEMIPRLCSTLGNNILLRWLEAQVEAEENAVPPAQNRTEVLTSVSAPGPPSATCSGFSRKRRSLSLTMPANSAPP